MYINILLPANTLPSAQQQADTVTWHTGRAAAAEQQRRERAHDFQANYNNRVHTTVQTARRTVYAPYSKRIQCMA